MHIVLLTIHEATKDKTDNISLNFRHELAGKPDHLSAFAGGSASVHDGYSGSTKEYRVVAAEDDEDAVVLESIDEKLYVKQFRTLDVGDTIIVRYAPADYGHSYEIRVSGTLI